MVLSVRICKDNNQSKYEAYSFDYPNIDPGYGNTRDEALLEYKKIFRTHFERMKLYMNILESNSALLVDIDDNGIIQSNSNNARIKEIYEPDKYKEEIKNAESLYGRKCTGMIMGNGTCINCGGKIIAKNGNLTCTNCGGVAIYFD